MEDRSVLTNSSQETNKLGEKFAQTVTQGTIFCLYGDLGSGKTVFTQGFAKGFGIEKKIISPTFVIIRTHSINRKSQIAKLKSFYHIDLYRIESERDLQALGLDEVMNDKESVVVIEWADRLGSLLPEKRTDVHFEYVGENTRKITVQEI